MLFLKVARSTDWWTSDGKLFQMRITCIAWLKECRGHDVQWCSDIGCCTLKPEPRKSYLSHLRFVKKACRYSGASIFRHLKTRLMRGKFLRYSKNWIPAACIIRARFGQIESYRPLRLPFSMTSPFQFLRVGAQYSKCLVKPFHSFEHEKATWSSQCCCHSLTPFPPGEKYVP